MTLHLIGYWTANTPALSQLIQVWMHNLDSQSYYNLLNAAAPPANLVTTYWSVNKESHIVSSWIGTRDNEWEPIMLRLIGYVGASRPGRGFTGQREPRCSGAVSWNLEEWKYCFCIHMTQLASHKGKSEQSQSCTLIYPFLAFLLLGFRLKERIFFLACPFMGVSCHICRSSKHTTWAY